MGLGASPGSLTYLGARGWRAVTDQQQNGGQLDTGPVSAALSTSLSWLEYTSGRRRRRRGVTRQSGHRPNNGGSRRGRDLSINSSSIKQFTLFRGEQNVS
jgi:hypothetical protein